MDLAELEPRLGRKGKTMKLDENTVITIVGESLNKLLKRLEIDVVIDHVNAGTPSRALIRGSMARVYEVPEDVVVVKNISTEYGIGTSKAHVHIYSDKDLMKKVEPEYVLKRSSA